MSEGRAAPRRSHPDSSSEVKGAEAKAWIHMAAVPGEWRNRTESLRVSDRA